MQPPNIRFKRAELKSRHDCWTAVRQLHFIDVLDATKSISKACDAVGMSRASAYKLRGHPEARQFRLALNAALRPDFAACRRDPSAKLTPRRQTTSSPLQTLQTHLAELRAQEQRLGSRSEG